MVQLTNRNSPAADNSIRRLYDNKLSCLYESLHCRFIDRVEFGLLRAESRRPCCRLLPSRLKAATVAARMHLPHWRRSKATFEIDCAELALTTTERNRCCIARRNPCRHATSV